MREKSTQSLVTELFHDGTASLTVDDPLRQAQPDIDFFNDVGAQLQEILGDEDFAIELDEQEGGLLFTLKVGDKANEPPVFSQPEPLLP